jgi:acyl-CoA synthetase (AMP-forming)/AMP-acid ligase II
MDGSHPYGRRLMPTILHLEAKNNPQRTFAIAAKSENIEGGFREVTFQQIAHAVNHVSHWLRRLFEDGNEPPRHATIAYIGVPDLRYNIIFLAAVQCRYQVCVGDSFHSTATYHA